MQGVAPGSHLITCDDATGRWVILLLMCALTHGSPLVVEMMFEAHFHRWVQASHAVDLDRAEASDGR